MDVLSRYACGIRQKKTLAMMLCRITKKKHCAYIFDNYTCSVAGVPPLMSLETEYKYHCVGCGSSISYDGRG